MVRMDLYEGPSRRRGSVGEWGDVGGLTNLRPWKYRRTGRGKKSYNERTAHKKEQFPDHFCGGSRTLRASACCGCWHEDTNWGTFQLPSRQGKRFSGVTAEKKPWWAHDAQRHCTWQVRDGERTFQKSLSDGGPLRPKKKGPEKDTVKVVLKDNKNFFPRTGKGGLDRQGGKGKIYLLGKKHQ